MATVSELLSQNVAQIISDVQTWSVFYNALEQGAKGDGSTDDYVALNKLFNQTITTDAIVIFPRGSAGYRIASNLIVPSNVTLYFVGEATLKPDLGKTVTINGGIIAGVYQIFSGAGTIIGKPIVEKFFPQWWGAVGDGIHDDTAAITAMKNTLTANGGTAFFVKGIYLVTDAALFTPPAGTAYVGDVALSYFKLGAALTSIPAYTIIPAYTALRVLVSNGSGLIGVSAVTAAQLAFLGTTTSDVQIQLDSKATNTFSNIAVPTQANVVADGPTDTLNLVGAGVITITTDPLTDTITISTAGVGAGTVTNVSSANNDIAVSSPGSTPVLALNSGSGANQIVKRDGSGSIQDVLTLQADVVQRGINVKSSPYYASGSEQITTGSITSGSNQLTVATAIDFAVGQGINVFGKYEAASLVLSAAPTSAGIVVVSLNGVAYNIPVVIGVAEVASLLVTAGATSSANCTVTLNGIAANIALTSGNTATQVATAIRAATFSGWATGGSGTTVTFTSTTSGTKTDAIYSAGTTGATGTMTTTTQGVTADTTTTVATAIRSTAFNGWTTGGSGSTVTFTAIATGVKTDATYSAGTTGTTGTMTTTTQGSADLITTITAINGLVFTLAANATTTVTSLTVSHNDALAIQSAVNALPAAGGIIDVPAGTYMLYSAVTLGNKFVTFRGDGKNSTILRVPIGFPTSSLGVIVVNGGESAGIIRDIQITFDQIDTAIRANLYAFPPAIYANSQPRIRIIDCKVVKAMTAIDIRGNCGGAYVQGCEISSLVVSIDMDNSLDSIHITDCHLWPFDLTTNQFVIYEELASIGIRTGRVDDLHISGCLIYNGLGFKSADFGNGVSFGEITNTDFDAHSGINISGGQFNITGCNFTISKVAYQAIVQTGGQLFIGTSWFYTAGNLASLNPVIQITGNADGETAFVFTGGYINTENNDVIAISTTLTNNTIIDGVYFRRLPNIAYAKPTIKIGGGRASIIGNRTKDKLAGAGVFVEVTSDDYNVIQGNSAPGWTYALPNPVNAIYKDNAVITQISAFRAIQTVGVNQTIPIGAFTKVNFATEGYDNLNEYDNTTSQFTVSQAGYYQIMAFLQMSSTASGTKMHLSIFKNGLEVARKFTYVLPTTDSASPSLADVIQLLATDVVDIRVYSSAATTTNPDSAAVSAFSMIKVG